MSAPVIELDAVGRASLASILSDVPETATTIARLRADRCRVWSCGDTVLVSCDSLAPGEPMAFGNDAAAILAMLAEVPGWRAVDVAPRAADALAALLAEHGIAVQPVADIYFATGDAPEVEPRAEARMLGGRDADLLDASREAFAAIDPSLGEPLHIAAGAIVNGALVSLCAVNALTHRHANLAVATLPDWRNRGFATAAAALVTAGVVRTRRRALWSCAETNLPSLAIARALGYQESSRRTLLVRE